MGLPIRVDPTDFSKKSLNSPRARLRFISLALSCESIYFFKKIPIAEQQLLDIFQKKTPFSSLLQQKISTALGVKYRWLSAGIGQYSPWGIRLLYLCKSFSKKIVSLARDIHVSASSLSMAISGNNPLSKKIAFLCRDLFSVSPDWLLTGVPPYMIKVSSQHLDQYQIFLENVCWSFFDEPDRKKLLSDFEKKSFCLTQFLDPRYAYFGLRLLSKKFEALGFCYNDILIVRRQTHAHHGQLIIFQDKKSKFFFAKRIGILYHDEPEIYITNDVPFPSSLSLDPNPIYDLIGVVVMSIHPVD